VLADNQIDQISDAYDSVADQLYEQWKGRNAIFNDRLNYFISLLNNKSKLLDIGCGFGRDVSYFKEAGLESSGVDTSFEMLELGRREYPGIDVTQDDFMRYLCTKPTYYDAIWCRGVLFHYRLEHLTDVAKNIHFALRKNGITYIQVSNKIGIRRESISNTKSELNYFYSSKEDYIQVLSQYFNLKKDLSTPKDICLVMEKK
jgi:SAM-dependent methyltransferase